ncbi:MAG: PfkB family carbohydrate kinase [Bacteroidota bacterium]
MKLVLIGHLAKDVHHLPPQNGAEEVHESLGGIMYSLATASFMLGSEGRVTPVFGVGEKDHESVIQTLESFGNVETKGVFKVKGPTNEVHFFPGADGAQVQCSKHLTPPIPFAKIKPHLDADGVLINMASGFDLTLETLDYIRMQVRDQGTPIHFDFHSLTLGIDQDQRRFRRPLTDWRRWCFMIHSIQMNEKEAAGLSSERYDEPTLINQLLPLMVQSLLITRGARGATLIRQEHKKAFRHEIPAVLAAEVIDTTGCGDVFGAAWFIESIRTKDMEKAASIASAFASRKATLRGFEGLRASLQHFTEVPAGGPP